MAEKVFRNFKVGGYDFRVELDRENEGIYRHAADGITEIYNRLHQKYPRKAIEELWMLTAFQAMSSWYGTKIPLEENIDTLTKEIEELLGEE